MSLSFWILKIEHNDYGDSIASSTAEEPLLLSILTTEEPSALSLSTDDEEFEGVSLAVETQTQNDNSPKSR